MLSNENLIKGFVKNDGKWTENGSMKARYMELYSYRTIIAERIVETDGSISFIVNMTKYSQTTSKQQSLLNCALFNTPYINVYRTTKHVPIGTYCFLKDYL